MTTKTKIDMTKFCDPDMNRVQSPWKIGDSEVAATDGRILVVVNAEQAEPFEPAEGQRPPNIKFLTEMLSSVTEWLSMPEPEPCDDCHNSGVIQKFCTECSGSM